MGEIRYIIIAKQCEVAGKSLILDGCLKKSFSSVYDLGKQFFGHPSRIDGFPCNLTQFCYIVSHYKVNKGYTWVVWPDVLNVDKLLFLHNPWHNTGNLINISMTDVLSLIKMFSSFNNFQFFEGKCTGHLRIYTRPQP